MKKRIVASILSLVMILTLTVGCGGSGETATGGNVDAKDLKIAILLPSSQTDGGWGQLGAEAFQKAVDQYGCTGTIVEAGTADKMKTEAENLANEGYQIVFGHGGQYAKPFEEINKENPDTLFVTAGGNVLAENQIYAEFVLEQMTYIEGAMAAKMSESGTIGMVIGGKFPAYEKTSRAFEMGAKSVNPDIVVKLGVTNKAEDLGEGYELTMSQINAGADVVCSNANQATLGSIRAAKENNVKFFGVVSDASKEAPDQVVASATQNFSALFPTVIDKYLAGDIKEESVKIGVEEGGIKWVWNDSVKAQLPEDVVSIYEDLTAKIDSGEIKVPGENEGTY